MTYSVVMDREDFDDGYLRFWRAAALMLALVVLVVICGIVAVVV